jgi:four helix bundle protein
MFIAYEVSLDLNRQLRPIAGLIAARDPALADQLRRAATSIALNLAEGRHRRGADRTRFYRIGAGSAAEVRAALELALAWQLADEAVIAEARATADRVLGMLWPLTR